MECRCWLAANGLSFLRRRSSTARLTATQAKQREAIGVGSRVALSPSPIAQSCRRIRPLRPKLATNRGADCPTLINEVMEWTAVSSSRCSVARLHGRSRRVRTLQVRRKLSKTGSSLEIDHQRRSLRHDRFRIVVRKKRRHLELAGLQILSAGPAIHHAGLHGLAGLDVGLPRKADEEIAVLRPIDAEPAIVLLSPLQEIRRNVILGVLLDLSPLG